MIRVELKALVAHLNSASRMALEEAASICVSSGHREVMVEHFLLALIEQRCADVRIICQANNCDPQKLIDSVRASFDRFRQSEGNAPVFSPLLVELLQDAWMMASIELGEKLTRGGAILLALLYDLGRFSRFEYASALGALPKEQIKRDFAAITAGSTETPSQHRATASATASSPSHGGESALAKYAHCFTDAARAGKIDPVFCRDNEIRQIIDILARRRKNNPICVGEAGVGKTAAIEGLALKIIRGDVPESLIGAEIHGLDLGALQAGASIKGEFEKRLKAVLDEVKSADRQTILFVDEAHTLIGAGGTAGGSDAANLLKPALARGELKTIAATTWPEYKKYFEKDPALTRRFQLVTLDEPTIAEARIILQGLVPSYEKAHSGVYISDEGVEAAVRLSARYITGRQLPDKAIDVLDTACARVRAAASGTPFPIERLEREAVALEREQAALERDRRAGHAGKALGSRIAEIEARNLVLQAEHRALTADHDKQRALAEQLRALRDQLADDAGQEQLAELAGARQAFETARKTHALTSLEVGAVEIASVIADWTGIPVASMTQDEIASLLDLSKTMGRTIKGQDHALRAIETQLQTAKLDLQRAGRPLGVFLLVGPSGVGKTETALEVARQLFGGEQFLTTVNMTEYQEKHSLSRLIGSPPGYVGYGEGGVLTEAIRKKPYSVVLLDEVEKADPDVLNLFYQAFDKGDLADGEGRPIDCRNVVFFLTSNLCSDEIMHLAAGNDRVAADRVEMAIRPLLAAHFKPALLARMQPLVYLPLGPQTMREIIAAKLHDLTDLLASKQGLHLDLSEDARLRLEALCVEAASGARLIDQMIQRRILPVISRAILQAQLDEMTLTGVAIDAGDTEDFGFRFLYAEDSQREAAQ